MATRAEILEQLVAEWEDGPKEERPFVKSSAGATVRNAGDDAAGGPAKRGWPKISWISHRLEELGESALSADERAQYCGNTTVTP